MNYQDILTVLPYYFSFSIYKPSKFESKSTNFKKDCIPFSLVFFSLFQKKKSQNEWFGKKIEPWFSGKMKRMIYFFLPITNYLKKKQLIIK
ncbi:hypothetical protein, partial [uncultured Dubosiella sp.]|uniref:hypothetical protein n=1 Tax=uncultured Dubosiella sp. TaxID=1937011 RepID=UPI00259AC973